MSGVSYADSGGYIGKFFATLFLKGLREEMGLPVDCDTKEILYLGMEVDLR